MIVIDSSAIVAILLAEAEASAFWNIVSQEAVIIGAPTLFETRMVLESRLLGQARQALTELITDSAITIVPFDDVMSEVAVNAFTIYGKGRGHPAGLNFGDCLSYAVAKTRSLPLLFKGDDFVHTDLVPAYLPAP